MTEGKFAVQCCVCYKNQYEFQLGKELVCGSCYQERMVEVVEEQLKELKKKHI